MMSAEFFRNSGIRMTRFVLANMMPAPAMEATEVQWTEQYAGDPDVGLAVTLAKFDDDCREGINPETREPRSRSNILSRYKELSTVERPSGILVLTGDNLEIEPNPEGLSSVKPKRRKPIDLDDITYGDRLFDLVKWGEDNAAVTVVSCLASHFVLNYFHNTPKATQEKKITGVYDHEIADTSDPFVKNMGGTFISPHSRWGDVSIAKIEDRNSKLKEARRLKILAASPEVGWLAIKEDLPNGHVRLYLQGHPEYDRDDLKVEWERDAVKDPDLLPPANYFKDNDPTNSPVYSWAHSARTFNHNTLLQACEISRASR